MLARRSQTASPNKWKREKRFQQSAQILDPQFGTRHRRSRSLVNCRTSTQDDGGHEEGQVAVVQLQGVELDGKLKFGLHDLAEGPPQAPQELAGDEALPVGHKEAVLVHERGQHGEDGLMDAVLEERHLVPRRRRAVMFTTWEVYFVWVHDTTRSSDQQVILYFYVTIYLKHSISPQGPVCFRSFLLPTHLIQMNKLDNNPFTIIRSVGAEKHLVWDRGP